MLPESLQFLRLIWAFQNGLEQASADMVTHLGVTGRQRFLLRVVGLSPGLIAEHLSTMLRVDLSVLEAEVTHLVGSGLLVAKAGAADGPPILHLTPMGATVNAANIGTVESAVSRALDEATPYERAAFRRMLERVTPYLDPAR